MTLFSASKIQQLSTELIIERDLKLGRNTNINYRYDDMMISDEANGYPRNASLVDYQTYQKASITHERTIKP